MNHSTTERVHLSFGFPGMRHEAGERRAFTPELMAHLTKYGARVVLEENYGGGMGLDKAKYQAAAPEITFASHADAYAQDYVVVLRCPADEDLRLLKPGACLISMLHYPTRPQRVDFLRSLGIEAISLDELKDDSGRRLVENLRAVAWNGTEVSFQELQAHYPAPGFNSPLRAPIRITLLGSGAVAIHVVQAAIRYANPVVWKNMAEAGVPGVQVKVVDFDTTGHKDIMLDLLQQTDILVDATQRPNPSHVVVPNDWISVMPAHAVLLDLSVDPYQCEKEIVSVKGIEGIPQGNLDQYIFSPEDPAYDTLPECVSAKHRRFAVSCYSWPGIHPKECMQVYGKQLRPLLRTLLERGGYTNIRPQGRFFERALARAKLSNWQTA